MGVGLYKQWYTAVLHPQRLIISNNFCPMYNDVFVRGESAVGVQSRDFFLTTLAPAYIRWAMWTIQEILLSSVSLGILHYTAMWGGQGDQHVRGQEREIRFPWVLQIPIRCAELVIYAFLNVKILRLHTDENHGNAHEEWVSCNETQNLPASVSRSASPPPNLSSIRYVQRSSFQKSAALRLLFSCLVICEPLPELCLFARHAIR